MNNLNIELIASVAASAMCWTFVIYCVFFSQEAVMAYGTCLLVSAGMSDFRCHFLCWIDDDKMLCLNRCGKQITVSQFDILRIYP